MLCFRQSDAQAEIAKAAERQERYCQIRTFPEKDGNGVFKKGFQYLAAGYECALALACIDVLIASCFLVQQNARRLRCTGRLQDAAPPLQPGLRVNLPIAAWKSFDDATVGCPL